MNYLQNLVELTSPSYVLGMTYALLRIAILPDATTAYFCFGYWNCKELLDLGLINWAVHILRLVLILADFLCGYSFEWQIGMTSISILIITQSPTMIKPIIGELAKLIVFYGYRKLAKNRRWLRVKFVKLFQSSPVTLKLDEMPQTPVKTNTVCEVNRKVQDQAAEEINLREERGVPLGSENIVSNN